MKTLGHTDSLVDGDEPDDETGLVLSVSEELEKECVGLRTG